MFTGLAEGTGKVRSIKRKGATGTYEFEAGFDLQDTNVGDSIAVNGCCLTVTSRLGSHFWADISDETLRISTLGGLKIGDEVNMERALRAGDRLGGHIVQGHVDGVGKILLFQDVENGKELVIEVPERLAKYMVSKGSVSIDGISLTINKTEGKKVSIRLVPHTVEKTTLKKKRAGDHLNLEVDIIGKYVEKLHRPDAEEEKESGITEDFLSKHGF